MTKTETDRVVLYRTGRGQLLGGVCGGIAQHIGVSARVMRVVFVLLSFAGGLGVVLYGAYWIVLPEEPGAPARSKPVAVFKYLLAAVATLAGLAFVVKTIPLGGQLFIPVMLALLGAALIWRQSGEVERERWWRLSRTSLESRAAERNGRLRVIAGAALVVLGGALVLVRADISAVRDGFIAMIVTAAGIALITGPWWMRTISTLSDERRERIRSQERAELAAHLHDSVLQTLALIQRNAQSPREVTRLARGQERELRGLLYRDERARGLLSEQLRAAAAEVEDAYVVRVEVVVVGEEAVDEKLLALVAAAREAMVNAAKHAGVETISLYAEVESEVVTAFVKDRGVGFDPLDIADDRQGVRGSVVARVERYGGTAIIKSAPGQGTEVQLRMPR
ncbi:MAG: putative signal transduction histidine kinase [Frankiales bacterium]|nr:putative signal transduction histidine kinase [Frankiales bacterium]